MKRVRLSALTFGVLFSLSAVTNCNNKGQLGSETNWLGHCDSSRDCARGMCMCGVCTAACTTSAACGGAVCVEQGTEAYIASCGAGASVPAGVCAAFCADARDCPDRLRCVAGACVAAGGARDAGRAVGDGDVPDAHRGGPATPDASGGSVVHEGGASASDGGGTGGRDSSLACTPDTLTTLEQALSAIEARSDFPAGSHITYIKGIQLTPDGRASWDLIYTDQTGMRPDRFDACGPVIERRALSSASTIDPCALESVAPLPSQVVTADALDRVTALVQYDQPSIDLTEATCADGSPFRAVSVTAESSDAGIGLERWDAYYGDAAVLEKLCGPCPAAETCTRCTAAPSAPFKLTAVTSTSQLTYAGCVAYDHGNLVQSMTTINAGGQLTNTSCVLAMAELTDGTLLMTGPSYDVDLATPESDGDSVRHSVNTVEDLVKNGTFRMKIYPLDALDDETQLIWSGSLFIGSFDKRTQTAWFAGTADPAP